MYSVGNVGTVDADNATRRVDNQFRWLFLAGLVQSMDTPCVRDCGRSFVIRLGNN